ncbi:MAG TPA: O-antigen ligase family protein [Verrucomicrobiae bacterium]|nr:O-antigen ligase family protein [Verrucomicrobiae bacterium]
MVCKSTATILKAVAVAFCSIIFLFAEQLTGCVGIIGSIFHEIRATFGDSGTQWMVSLCFGIHFVTFSFLRFRSNKITNPTLWLAGAIFIGGVAYAFKYSPSIQALTLLGGAVIGLGAGFLKCGKRKTESGNKTDWGVLIVRILVVLLVGASVWNGDVMHSFEYRSKMRWSGPWNNPNNFGLLMGAGVALAVGGAVSSLGFRVLSSETEGKYKARIRKWWKWSCSVLCVIAAIFMMRGLFHSFSRGAWMASICGLAYLAVNWFRVRSFELNGCLVTKVGRVTPCAPEHGRYERGAHGVARPTIKDFFNSLSCVSWLKKNIFAANVGSSSPRPSPPLMAGERVSEGRERGLTQQRDLLSCDSYVSWLKKNLLPLSVIVISVIVLLFWQFRHTEWVPARRAFSAANANDFSWRNRVAAWEGALQIMAEHPWLGVGWNRPEPLYDHYYLPPKVSESAAIEMNDYLMLGATLGVPALFCFCMYIWLSLGEVPSSRFQVSTWQLRGARPPRALFFAPSRKTSVARDDSEAVGLSHASEVECEAHSTAPGAGALPGAGPKTQNAKLETKHSPPSDWLSATCRAGALILAIGFWFDGGLFKLATASVFWILLELGQTDFPDLRTEASKA